MSSGTSSRDVYSGAENEMCIASSRASSAVPPSSWTSTPIFFAGGWTYDASVPPSKRVPSTTTMFSPSWAISSTRSASSASAASAPLPFAETRSSAFSANSRNASFFDTGSVSQPTPTIAAASPLSSTSTMPSVVARSARLPAAAIPFSRRSVRAASMSPPVSCSARLQSIIPAPV